MRRKATMLLMLAALTLGSASSSQADVPSIMPLGDSITEGLGTPGNDPGGYRTQLYTDLKNAGIAINYVGSSTTNSSATLQAAGQTNHEGHGGYRVDQIANNLDGSDGTQSPSPNNGGFWFTGGNGTGRAPINPNIILLHIGTNDIVQNFNLGTNETNLIARLDALVGQITTDRPDAKLFVAAITPINNAGENAEVQAYNAAIANTIVPKYENLGKHVYFVNQYAAFVNPDGSFNTALFDGDGIHPNDTGYNLMGDTWFNAIVAVPEPGSALLLALGVLAILVYHFAKFRGIPAVVAVRSAAPRRA